MPIQRKWWRTCGVWPHSGFSVDQSVYLPAGDRAGIERLVAYMMRCPFSLSRLVKVTKTGQVIYKAEKDACRAFPDPQRRRTGARPPAEFPDPRPAGIPGGVHAAHSAEGGAFDSLLRLVLEHLPGSVVAVRQVAVVATTTGSKRVPSWRLGVHDPSRIRQFRCARRTSAGKMAGCLGTRAITCRIAARRLRHVHVQCGVCRHFSGQLEPASGRLTA